MASTTQLGKNLFREDGDDGPVLLGGRCAACGRVAFPFNEVCWTCRSDAVALCSLGNRAELICATRVEMATRNFAPGFVVGYVSLPHDIRMFSQLAPEVLDLPCGAALRLAIDVLWNEDGTDVRGYRFIPAGDGADHA